VGLNKQPSFCCNVFFWKKNFY